MVYKKEEKLGGNIVLRALQEPVRQIAINAGLEPAVILEKSKKLHQLELDLMLVKKNM